MYKISNKVIKFITETMKNWKAELTAGGKTLEVKIQRDMFQGYKFTKSQEKTNHLIYMDDIN